MIDPVNEVLPGEEVTQPRKKPKRGRRKTNRRSSEPAQNVLVAVDNPKGIRWVMEFAPIYASILHGIEQTLSLEGKRMQVCSVRDSYAFESLLRISPPDGILFLASRRVMDLKEIIGTIPCVSVLGAPCDGFFDRVAYSDWATGQLPADYFMNQGITSAAILGPTEPGRHSTFGVRCKSFCVTMEDGGGHAVRLLTEELYEPDNPDNQPRASEVAKLVGELKKLDPLPKGLFVMADNLLPTVYAQLAEAGLGTAFTIASCNAEPRYLKGLDPKPASVVLPAEEMGRRAVELLDWRSRHPNRPTSTTVFPPILRLPNQFEAFG